MLSVHGSYFPRLCPNNTIHKNFAIQSVTWLEKDQFLILHESFYIIARYVNEKQMMIIDIRDGFSFGGFRLLHPSKYLRVFFLRFTDGLYLNWYDTALRMMFDSKQSGPINHGDKGSYQFLLNQKSNGILFYERVEGIVAGTYSMANKAFNLREIIQQISSAGFSPEKLDKNQMTFNNRDDKSKSVFQNAPPGFSYKNSKQHYIYILDVDLSLVYRFKFDDLFPPLMDNKPFSVLHETFTFREFFICISSNQVHQTNLSDNVIIGIVLAIVITILVASVLFITKNRNAPVITMIKPRSNFDSSSGPSNISSQQTFRHLFFSNPYWKTFPKVSPKPSPKPPRR